MSKILIIEESSTLRHVLLKILTDSEFEVDIEVKFEDGLRCLESTNGKAYSAVIIGWPNITLASADDLLSLLCDKKYQNIALLALSHETEAAKIAWASSRPKTGFLLWSNYGEIVQSVRNLMSNHTLTVPVIVNNELEPIRILLVDDSPTARVKFRRLLVKNGYRTDAVSSPEEALKKVKSTQYDIAIIDYFMPVMTGDELCQRFQDDIYTSSIVCAILTSAYADKVITDSLQAGAVECMFKNESDNLFLARVSALSRNVQNTKQINQEHKRLNGILSSVGDGVFGINNNNEINFINPTALNILGYADGEHLIGKKPHEVFHTKVSQQGNEKISAKKLYKNITKKTQKLALETYFIRFDGNQTQVELTIFPLQIEGKTEGAVIAFRDISERKLLEEELMWQVNHDPLTKMFNRKYFEDALEEEVRRLKRSNDESALLYIDLDRFKYINDTAGHATGDQLLIELGHMMNQRLRESDLLARIGGDEFAVIMRNIDKNSITEAVEKFQSLLSGYEFSYKGREYKIHASIGVAMINKGSASPGEVLSNSDIACYVAKTNGRDQVHVYDAVQDEKAAMDLDLGWSTRLQNAMEDDNFELHFQPILLLSDIHIKDLPNKNGELWNTLLKSKAIQSPFYEVLIRLPDSNNSIIAPGAFLPTAERFNLMPSIDRWVINDALRQLSILVKSYPNAQISINLSGQTFDNDEIVEDIQQNIEHYKLNPSSIIFEITESSAIYNIESAQRLIKELTWYGCKFALDDFGSGYCSFSHLKNLPVDYIKIDGMFIQELLHDSMDLAIIKSITEISHALGKKTVAEFVENAEVLQKLKECGVDYVQGYYIAPPKALNLIENDNK
ncbi:diguanylate cyclase/phosphodiesterase (GGDEF & EAL domains) with PAS/PAC sensor(s) [hydrothermal vent metagenome]|uniref:Diguanylate cyclase/phosphodiesterase (GGDEF & EAL domains) with PAS/PAC sensor(S) n=1 Tax=hydrothermal vent metagenome TaxID=652676 RepID=A0A3B1AJV8_9ZZZZ